MVNTKTFINLQDKLTNNYGNNSKTNTEKNTEQTQRI